MHTKITTRELAIELGIFVLVFASISYFYKSNILLTSLLLCAWAVGMVCWHSKRDIVLFISGAILGPLAEIVVIQFGVWSYSSPVAFGIPPWLPLAWGEAAVFIYKMANVIYYKIEKN